MPFDPAMVTGNEKVLKKGTYKIKIKVRAAGNDQYKRSKWKKVTCKIKVRYGRYMRS